MSVSSDSVSALKETSTSQRVAEAAHEAVEEAAAKAEKVERQLRDHAAQAGEKLEASQEVAMEQMERSIERIESFVKSRPIAAAGIAFAAGVMATALLRR